MKSSEKILHANQIQIFDEQITNSYPYVVRSTRNNGIRGYVKQDKEFLNPANTLTFAQDTFCVFYQKQAYFTGNNVKILKSKMSSFNDKIGIFISAICNKVLEDFSWGVGSTQDFIKEILISIPVYPHQHFSNINTSTQNNIAFDFMENYIKELEQERIKELEQERIKELEAYLLVAGFKDTKLTHKEKEALQIFARLSENQNPLKNSSLNSGNFKFENFLHSALVELSIKELENTDLTTNSALEWKEFKLGDLFEIKPTKAYKMTNPILFQTKGDVPVVTNSSTNNGISGYVNLEPTEKGNMIIYSDTTTSEGIFYQPRDFVGYSHIQGLYPLHFKDKWNKTTLLYIVVAFRKSSFGKFDYGNKFNRNIAKELIITLPTYKNEQIAFDFMENFIKSIEKVHIDRIYKFWETKLQAYNAITENRETEKQRNRETEKQRNRETEKQRNRETEKQRNRETEKQRNRETPKFILSEYENFIQSFTDTNSTPYTQILSRNQLCWKEFKLGELFEVKSNPQLNKDSFEFNENAEYPYFTRTCLNNGIAGYVKYLDEEHKIKGNTIAVGMLGMQFFYMQKDFYAGQFTKTIYPKFERFNDKIAHFFIVWFNKSQKNFQGVLVRDFEKTFNEKIITLPTYKNEQIAFDFMEDLIKATQKEVIKNVMLWQEKQKQAYEKVMNS